MAIVMFDPAAFKIRYPAFAGVSDAMLTACFNDAGFYLSNSDGSPVQDVDRRERLLWMVTAHLAYLDGALSADGLPRPVGIMTSATEGSVSIGVAAPNATPGSGEWFKQTQWGAQFWQATTALRGFRWVP